MAKFETKLGFRLIVGETVYSMYDDIRGKVIEIVSTDGLQDEYRVKWKDGIISNAFREELY